MHRLQASCKPRTVKLLQGQTLALEMGDTSDRRRTGLRPVFGKQEASQLGCSHVLFSGCCVNTNGKRGGVAAKPLNSAIRNSSNQNNHEHGLCVYYEPGLHVIRLVSLPAMRNSL